MPQGMNCCYAYENFYSFDVYLVCPDDYVICLGCKSPDTIFLKENRLLFIRCEQVINGLHILWMYSFSLHVLGYLY